MSAQTQTLHEAPLEALPVASDRIVVLEAGQIYEEGTHDQLVAHGGRYASLFELQAASYR